LKTRLLSSEETEWFGYELGKRVLLRPNWGKDIFLFGDIGAGKTTLLKGFARGLGIFESVSSPTFSLVSEYSIPKNSSQLNIFSHLDIFRINKDSVLTMPEIFEKVDDLSVVFALEWAEKFPKHLFPEKRIEIHLSPGENINERGTTVHFIDPSRPSDKAIRDLLNECAVPVSIRKHTAIVTKIATFFAKKLEESKSPIDLPTVRASAFLHNCFWFCEYSKLIRDQFPEDVDDHSWNIWNALFSQYKGLNQGEAAQKFLQEKGYNSVADIVSHQNEDSVFQPLTFEEQCLCLGNRYAKNGKIIPLFKQLQKTPTKQGRKLLSLEKEICNRINILPTAITDALSQ
jgi:tRNA threonylcarbamoyladenosine biosynthesis protein TsaE